MFLPLNTYSMMCRCPMRDAARIKALADKENVTVSSFMARMVNDRVKGLPVTSIDEAWIEEYQEMNEQRREKVDGAFACGRYKRPKKRGRPKGSKNLKKETICR